MAIKPPELLNRIPSVSELLEKPPIRALVNRWNQSAVAGSVRNYLEQLRGDLQRRAAELPSIRELAERAAQYVVSQQQKSLGVTINATGIVCGPPWSSVPLADAAMERIVTLAREFAAAPSEAGTSTAESEALLCRITGAQAAAVAHSYSTALWMTLSALAADREVLVGSGDIHSGQLHEQLPNLAVAARAHLKQVGTQHVATAADYEAAVTPLTSAILKTGSGGTGVPRRVLDASELVPLSRERDLVLIGVSSCAPLTDDLPEAVRLPSARSSLASGVDIVMLEGSGLVGGPPCGIILGRQTLVRRIASHPLFSAVRLDDLRVAALQETLKCYDGTPRSLEALPVWQCVSAPLANLRNRAERLAPQLAQMDGLSSTSAAETSSPLCTDLAREIGCPSYGVNLTPADGNIQALDRRLRSAAMPIRGRIEGDRLVLDLRTVFPRQDRMLVESLVGSQAESVGTEGDDTELGGA
jgi:L-seryl-tRNA(Ser) seleniumtransferase